MANTIRIARSTSTNTPSSLAQGEVAYSEDGSPNAEGELFIGTAGPAVTKITTTVLTGTDGVAAQPNASAQDNQTITTGTGIDGADGGSSGDVTLSLALDELSVATMVTGDWIAFDNAGVSNKALISGINLSLFNDNLGHVENATHTGQVTGATALSLAITAITDQPASGAIIAGDTILTNDGGTLSETTFTQLNTYFNSSLGFLTSEIDDLSDVTGRGATTATASTFSGGLFLSDSDLSRPVLEDYGVKHQAPTVTGNAVAVNLTLGNSVLIDMDPATAAVVLTLTNPPTSGVYGEVNLTIVMGTPAWGMTWPGSITWLGGGSAPTLTTTDNVVDLVHLFTVDGGTTWYGTYSLAAAGASGTFDGLTDTNFTSVADGAMALYDTGTSMWIDNIMSGDATMLDTGAVTVAADAISYAKMQNVVADDVFLGNNSGAGAIVDELTGTEATALLDLFVTSSTVQGLVPGSNSLGDTYYLDGNGVWTIPSGAGSVTSVGTGIGLTGGPITDSGTIDMDFSSLTDMTGNISGTTEFIVQNGSTESRKAASEIQLGFFNNNSNWETNDADTVLTTDTSVSGWSFVLDEDAMGSNSATKLPTQQSVKAYVDNAVTGGLTHKGGYNASTNTPALDTGTPTLVLGDMYTVTAAGTFFTVELEIGDVLISDVDSTDAAAIGDWTIVQANIGGATETTAGYIEIATQAEMDTGTDDDRAVTPLKYASSTIDGGTF